MHQLPEVMQHLKRPPSSLPTPLTHFLPSWMTMRPRVELAALDSSHSPWGTSSTWKKPTAVTGLIWAEVNGRSSEAVVSSKTTWGLCLGTVLARRRRLRISRRMSLHPNPYGNKHKHKRPL